MHSTSKNEPSRRGEKDIETKLSSKYEGKKSPRDHYCPNATYKNAYAAFIGLFACTFHSQS